MDFPMQEFDIEETEHLLSDAVNYGADNMDNYTIRNRRNKKGNIATNICR